MEESSLVPMKSSLLDSLIIIVIVGQSVTLFSKGGEGLVRFLVLSFPGGSDDKESACNARDLGSIPGSGRSPGEGNGNPFQYSCLENIMGKGACWATSVGSQRVRHD